MKKFEQTPNEVLHVWWIQWSKQPIGISTYERCQEIINKYPEYFPWEHKHKAISAEVHEAFGLECYPKRYEREEWLPSITEGKGILHEIQKGKDKVESYKVKHHDTLRSAIEEVMQVMRESEQARIMQEKKTIAEEQRVKAIWKKHYDKYNLEYRSNTEFKMYQKW